MDGRPEHPVAGRVVRQISDCGLCGIESSAIKLKFTPSAGKALAEEAWSQLLAGGPARLRLPEGISLHLDRAVPFMFLHRIAPGGEDSGASRLVLGESAYMVADGSESQLPGLRAFLAQLLSRQAEKFGAALLVETWTSKKLKKRPNPDEPWIFTLHRNRHDDIEASCGVIRHSLEKIKLPSTAFKVVEKRGEGLSPAGLPKLFKEKTFAGLDVHRLGIEVPAAWQLADGTSDPQRLQRLLRGFARTLKRAAFEFTVQHTAQRPAHFLALGRRSFVRAVWEVDRRLARLMGSVDFLMLMTPINGENAWREFKTNHYQKEPRLHYPWMEVEAPRVKRDLYQVPMEKIEDPELKVLFQQQRDELDWKLAVLQSRGTKNALYGSLVLYGKPDKALLDLATRILEKIDAGKRSDATGSVDAKALALAAEKEIAYYRNLQPSVSNRVEIRGDATSLVVNHGNLVVGERMRVPQGRVQALLNHEIGTHTLTWINGGFQPFHQLQQGFAGYDELQEALAVLSEALLGAFSEGRLRLLALRVMAADSVASGASLVDTFRRLTLRWGSEPRQAFQVALRVHRGGGLTKDLVYLRGLVRLLKYLAEGGDIEPLYIGKYSFEHMAIIRDLRLRKVLKPPKLLPRFLSDPLCQRRLEAVAKGLDIFGLTKLGGTRSENWLRR